jgi:hypothetical protein
MSAADLGRRLLAASVEENLGEVRLMSIALIFLLFQCRFLKD